MINRIKILVFSVVCIIINHANAQFVEQFTDGGFNANPNWDGTEADFSVNAERILVLNGVTDNGIAYLSTANILKENVSFEFYLKLDFQPNENDFARIYLMSNNNDLTQANQAYLLQINQNNSLQFVKQNGNDFEVLLTLLENQLSSGIDGNIKVIKTGACKWNFYFKPFADAEFIILDSLIENTDDFENNYFGILGNYTLNSKSKFYFDDFEVGISSTEKIIEDTLKIKRIDATQNLVNITLDKKINNPKIVEQTNRFLINNSELIASINLLNDTILQLTTNSALDKNKIYTLKTIHQELCAINDNLDDSLVFAVTDLPEKNDILINEIMFYTDKEEYVEFYNNTDKLFQLRDIVLKQINPQTQIETDSYDFDSENYFIQPKDYFIITKNKSNAILYYNDIDAEKVIENSLSSLNDDKEIIEIANTQNRLIDKFKYESNFHAIQLENTKNISLERINSDFKTQDKNNWYSASKNANYATPTKKNSAERNINTNKLGIEPSTFSPDFDGYNDVLNISYAFDEPATLANLFIYNAEGRIVRTILKNEILPQNGFIIWDGFDDNGNKASVGIYFLILEATEPSGRKVLFKEKCVLATYIN